MPSTCARQLPQSPVRQSVPGPEGDDPDRRIAIATESPAANGDRPTVDDDASRFDEPRRSGALGHWRILVLAGSNKGSGWRRAGRRRPMISISKPSPPGPSGVASSVGT